MVRKEGVVAAVSVVSKALLGLLELPSREVVVVCVLHGLLAPE